MGKIFLRQHEVRDFMKNKSSEIPNPAEYYTNHVIKKYSKEEQDKHLNDIIHLIQDVPGGYWQVVEMMGYLSEFEHYRYLTQISYEKGNVPPKIARRELRTTERFKKKEEQ